MKVGLFVVNGKFLIIINMLCDNMSFYVFVLCILID